MSIITLTIVLICLNSCSHIIRVKDNSNTPQNFVVSYYENGNIEYESEYENGKLHGVSKHWSENGILLNSVEYKYGKTHGSWIHYYPSGVIKQITVYKFGKKNGDEKWFYENSQLQSVVTYENGMQVSNIVRYDKNGNLIY
jgi:antitoxin component YwqK of YwqJK toxin-antitoxin module